MKAPARYKVDVSKRLSGRDQKAWHEREEALALILKAVKIVVIALVILYPWNKYQDAYIPLTEGVSGKQAEIAKLNADITKSTKQLEELMQRSRQVVRMRQERLYWSDKLLNMSLWMPDKVFITEISSQGKSFIMHGLTPILEKGVYIAKIAALTEKINGDQVFTKNFQLIQLNYTKQTKVSQPNLPQPMDMVEFELEAEAR